MHNQQQQRMDEVAQQFADAVVAAYRTTSGGTVAAQELGARLTEYFLNSVITRSHLINTAQVMQVAIYPHRIGLEKARNRYFRSFAKRPILLRNHL
jgi:hypothetical protein